MTHPIINAIKTEWGYLGKRRKWFIFYIFLFLIAGIVSLLTPYVIGTIFNSIQESITTHEELVVLMKKIALLLVITWSSKIFGNYNWISCKEELCK